ncbi:MAG TPA: DUF4126 domain-containing protein [Candidatus Eremiobacteraceae bacterium]
MDTTTEYALAFALTTTAGLRGFLALLVASLAAHAGWIHLNAPYAWLGSDAASIVLAVFAVLEILADKFPVIDNALHVVYFVVRPAAAAILVGGTVHAPNQGELIGLMVLGALNAFVVHGAAAATRAASTAATLGAANPVLSVGEDIVALGGSALAITMPIVAAVLALVLVVLLLVVAGRIRARARRRVAEDEQQT